MLIYSLYVIHDWPQVRPDYQKLHQLRQMLPSVPIMALSATCPPLVLKDLLKTLRLPDIVDGRSALWLDLLILANPFLDAKPSGTVYFFSPLYRKNLHYCVVPKPSKASDVTKEMVDYILEHHPNDSGIVYCLSKKVSAFFFLTEPLFDFISFYRIQKKLLRNCENWVMEKSELGFTMLIVKEMRKANCTRLGAKARSKWFARQLVGSVLSLSCILLSFFFLTNEVDFSIWTWYW